LARRFVCETCDFLAQNWDFERVWRPLRCGGASATGKSDRPKSEATETISAVPVVSLRIDATAADGLGLGETHLFVLVPLARGNRGTPVGLTDASAGAMGDDEDRAIWVPEIGAPSRAPSRAPRRSTMLQ